MSDYQDVLTIGLASISIIFITIGIIELYTTECPQFFTDCYSKKYSNNINNCVNFINYTYNPTPCDFNNIKFCDGIIYCQHTDKMISDYILGKHYDNGINYISYGFYIIIFMIGICFVYYLTNRNRNKVNYQEV